MAAKTKAKVLMEISPQAGFLRAPTMAKASARVKQIFMNDRSGREFTVDRDDRGLMFWFNPREG
jgi:hypothetical protein